jgi:glycosyltransferase involved in cell wall biosynthesis
MNDATPGPGCRPRILLLTWVSPLEPWGGAAQRTRLLMDALGRCGELEVLVVHLSYPGSTRSRFTEHSVAGLRVMHLGIKISSPFALPHFDIPSSYITREVAKHVDLANYGLIVSRYVKPVAKVIAPQNIPLIVDFDDAVFSPPWRTLRGVKAWLGALVRVVNDRVILRLRLRHGALSRAHYFFCESGEREAFPWLRASVLPNLPVIPERTGPPSFEPPERPALMFLGLLDYPPNRDAVEWFLTDMWPTVLRGVPDARFLIAGKGPDELCRRWAAHPRVELLGFVERLSEVYARASASVVPMRAGGGTPIKALEAYHYGRMVVATSRVLAGHRPLFRSGLDMLVADDAPGFAEHCIAVLRNPALARGIAASGYARISSELTSERFAAIVREAVHATLGAAVGSRTVARLNPEGGASE